MPVASPVRRWHPLAAIVLAAWCAIFSATPVLAPASPFERGWSAYEREDYTTALEIWLPLASEGNVGAQINVGLLYNLGFGVERDLAAAAHWYETAAAQGSELAQYNLGMLLVEGGDPSTLEGLVWLERSADRGLPQAQFELGSLICEGKGVPADPVRGVEWIYLAGIGYLTRGDPDGARTAASAIRDHQPSDDRANQLERRIASFTREPDGWIDEGTAVSVGTAWVIAEGYAVTNLHVVDGCDALTLETTGGETLRASIAMSDPENDLVLLQVEDPRRLPAALPLARGSARLGTSVFTIGFPRIDVMGTTPKLTDGIISGTNGVRDNPNTYQISVPIQPGNSGGPLLDMHGRVVGVVASMLGTITDPTGEARPLPNVNYAVKTAILAEIVTLLPASHTRPSLLPSGETSLEELAARVQDSVLIVRAQ